MVEVRDQGKGHAVRAIFEDLADRDLIVEAVGKPETWEIAPWLLVKGGRVNLFGGCPSGTTCNLDTQLIHYSGLTLLAIGFALTLIHLISIPVTNTSVNPARSTGPAIFVGGWALQQLWLFWLAPIVGAAIAGFTYKALLEGERVEPPVSGRVER